MQSPTPATFTMTPFSPIFEIPQIRIRCVMDTWDVCLKGSLPGIVTNTQNNNKTTRHRPSLRNRALPHPTLISPFCLKPFISPQITLAAHLTNPRHHDYLFPESLRHPLCAPDPYSPLGLSRKMGTPKPFPKNERNHVHGQIILLRTPFGKLPEHLIEALMRDVQSRFFNWPMTHLRISRQWPMRNLQPHGLHNETGLISSRPHAQPQPSPPADIKIRWPGLESTARWRWRHRR